MSVERGDFFPGVIVAKVSEGNLNAGDLIRGAPSFSDTFIEDGWKFVSRI